MAEPLRLEMDSMGNDNGRIIDLIARTPMKDIPFSEIMANVQEIWSLVMKGAHKKDLYVPLETMGFCKEARDTIVDIAITRKRSHGKYEHGDKLFFTSEGLRWATPQSAADHCSKRMARALVLDVTCGQGGQVLSLADTCERVIGIDLDPLNCLVSIMNCKALKKENVTVINGDCLDPKMAEFIEEGCAIFIDPSRPPGASERTMDEILPDPREIKNAYENRAGGMCFELPPYISSDKVDFDCEYEFISIDGRVNRLNIYTGDLISAERSAVVLPGEYVLKGRPQKTNIIQELDLEVGGLIYEVDPAVVRAGLETALAEELNTDPLFLHLDGRRRMLSSSTELRSSFLKQGYRMLACNVKHEELVPTLRKLDAGSVTLRYTIDPKDYWQVRRSLETQLEGSKKVDLFKGKDHLIMERF